MVPEMFGDNGMVKTWWIRCHQVMLAKNQGMYGQVGLKEKTWQWDNGMVAICLCFF